MNCEEIEYIHYSDNMEYTIKCPYCGSEWNHIYETRITRGNMVDVLSGNEKAVSDSLLEEETHFRGSRIRTGIICEECRSLFYLSIQFSKGNVLVYTEKTKTLDIPLSMHPREFYRN